MTDPLTQRAIDRIYGHEPSRDEMIADMQDLVSDLRDRLDDFRRSAGEGDDMSNESGIHGVTAGLDMAEGHLGDLVP